MNSILNIGQDIQYDNSIMKLEYRSYAPFLNSFNNNDEIRISIQNQDLYILPSESFIYVEGRLLKLDNTVSQTAGIVKCVCLFIRFSSI